MDSIISRLQALQAFQVHPVNCGELGRLHLKAFNGNEAAAFFAAGKEAAVDPVRLVSLSLCDEEGNRLFSTDENGKLCDAAQLVNKIPGMTLLELAAEAMKLSKLGDDPKKN